MLINLYDNEDNFGGLSISHPSFKKNILLKEIENEVEQYIKADEEEYNIDGLCDWLRQKGYLVKTIKMHPIYF